VVWLVGVRAYKLKRAVAFDYVDFSTVGLRRAACEAEVRLNRRTAPSLYLGVRALATRSAGSQTTAPTSEQG
jgi:aminoglycoside phosphotransferase family enzyme